MSRKLKIAAVTLAFLLCVICCVLAGCSALKSAEKKITVTVEMDGVTYDSYTVHIFKNALIFEEPAKKDGMVHRGWALKPDWTEGVDDEKLFIDGDLIRYDDVKDYAVDGRVTVYPAYKAERYFVLGWYARSTTSGLDKEIVAPMEAALKEFLKEQGATDEQLALTEVRAVDGDVAEYGAQIRKAGDFDLFIGCGNNIDGDDGGRVKTVLAKTGGFTVGGKTGRRLALLNDDDMAIKAYNWLQGYIAQNIDTAYTVNQYVKPDGDPENITDYNLVIGYWAGNANSGLATDGDKYMKSVKIALDTYLKEKYNATDDDLAKITFKLYNGNVASIVGSILDGDGTDIVLGTTNNISTTAATSGNHVGEKVEVRSITGGIAMGDREGRYVALINYAEVKDIATAVYNWMVAEGSTFRTAVVTKWTDGSEPEIPETDPTEGKELVLMWYAHGNSAIKEEDAAELDAEIKEYLAGKGISADKILVLKSVVGNHGALVDDIQGYKKVDIVIGAGTAIATTGGTVSGNPLTGITVSETFKINGKTGRTLVRLNGAQLTLDVYDWLWSYKDSHFGNGAQEDITEIADYNLVIGYMTNSASGLNVDGDKYMASVKAALAAYLKTKFNATDADIEKITFVPYKNNAAANGGISADGTAILLGPANTNIGADVSFKDSGGATNMGTSTDGKRLVLLVDTGEISDIAQAVFNWMVAEDSTFKDAVVNKLEARITEGNKDEA